MKNDRNKKIKQVKPTAKEVFKNIVSKESFKNIKKALLAQR